jgi:hypothetical protein
VSGRDVSHLYAPHSGPLICGMMSVATDTWTHESEWPTGSGDKAYNDDLHSDRMEGTNLLSCYFRDGDKSGWRVKVGHVLSQAELHELRG